MENHPDSDYIGAVREKSPASTQEVAEIVGVTRQGSYYRLKKLRERGKVKSKTVGRELIWMVVSDE